jgi:hypothetical protein
MFTKWFGGGREEQAQAAMMRPSGRGAGNIFTAEDWRSAGRQEVHVTVGVDPKNGSIRAYVDQGWGEAMDGLNVGPRDMSSAWMNPR